MDVQAFYSRLETVADACREIDDIRQRAGAGAGYSRNFTLRHHLYSPVVDLSVRPGNPADFDGLTSRVASGLATESTPDNLRLDAGTTLELVGGSNNVWEDGEEASIFLAHSGVLTGNRIAFIEDHRQPLDAAITEHCLQSVDGAERDEAWHAQIDHDIRAALAKFTAVVSGLPPIFP